MSAESLEKALKDGNLDQTKEILSKNPLLINQVGPNTLINLISNPPFSRELMNPKDLLWFCRSISINPLSRIISLDSLGWMSIVKKSGWSSIISWDSPILTSTSQIRSFRHPLLIRFLIIIIQNGDTALLVASRFSLPLPLYQRLVAFPTVQINHQNKVSLHSLQKESSSHPSPPLISFLRMAGVLCMPPLSWGRLNWSKFYWTIQKLIPDYLTR